MGAALAQKFAQENFKVRLIDVDLQSVERGISAIKKSLEEGVSRKIFNEEQTHEYLSNIRGYVQLKEVQDCDLVIEAIFEDFGAKTKLLEELSEIVDETAILATNTSSFSVTELSGAVKNPKRFVGMHYFYHAAKNRLVEIIPGKETSEETFNSMMAFAFLSGKDPITCSDSYGFVVNRFFVPWLNEATRLLEEEVANMETIDEVCMQTFGIGMGPFKLMNATGIPVAYHSQKTLEVFGSFYKPSKTLKMQAEVRKPWDLSDSAVIETSSEQEIKERMLGVVFLVCSQLLDESVCNAEAINRGARIGLSWKKGPVDLMIKLGIDEVKRLISKVAEHYGIETPHSIGGKYWDREFVNLDMHGTLAVITLSRPEDMNALNEGVLHQLEEKFSEAESNPETRTIIITGTGKAFVAGADIKFFVQNIKNNAIDKIVEFARLGHQVFERIDNSKKRVVAILNGLTLGGGLELALCADTILAVPKTKMAFPETGIGIFPGLGGTQRTSQRVGKGLAKWLILTGTFLNATQALEIGLIDEIIEPEKIFDLIYGNIPVPEKVTTELEPKWSLIAQLYEHNSYHDIIEGHLHNGDVDKEFVSGLVKAMTGKAPVAMEIAERLINKSEGYDGELREMGKIFSTEDALLGLTTMGHNVKYNGR